MAVRVSPLHPATSDRIVAVIKLETLDSGGRRRETGVDGSASKE